MHAKAIADSGRAIQLEPDYDAKSYVKPFGGS